MLDPIHKLWTTGADRSLPHFEGGIEIAQFGIAARDVVERERIVGIDRESAGNPFTRSFHITEFEECARTQVRRPRIIGMQCKFALGKLESEARGFFTIFDPAEGSITM